MKSVILINVILIFYNNLTAQSNQDFENFSLLPKNQKEFPVDYKILLPTLEFTKWDDDYDKYIKYLTPELRKTQIGLTYTEKGIYTIVTTNSIVPHAQLDTATIIKNTNDLKGIWRMITFRTIKFNDSVNILANKYYRLPSEILYDKSKDDAFIVISNTHFSIYAKEIGNDKFKKRSSSKYNVANKRYIMLYKLFKASAGVSQIGIDENGYLIINYPKVIEYSIKDKYISYYTIIEQYILEKIK